MLTRVIPLVCSPVELAEADVAVGKERAHPELAGERQGCTVVVLRVSTVEGTGMSGDLAEEVEGPGFVPALPALSSKAEGLARKGDRVVESVPRAGTPRPSARRYVPGRTQRILGLPPAR